MQKIADDLKDVKVSFKAAGNNGTLKVSGGPRNDFSIRIEIPKNSDLRLRVAAGDVNVEDLIGDKDVEMWAGDLTLRVGNAADYGKVDASVRAGDLDMGPVRRLQERVVSFLRDYRERNPPPARACDGRRRGVKKLGCDWHKLRDDGAEFFVVDEGTLRDRPLLDFRKNCRALFRCHVQAQVLLPSERCCPTRFSSPGRSCVRAHQF